ncbi:MAG: hypothetical protein QOE22_148 [Candidatus Parcubacteria bacterium]|jgi:hypothetical protein|nr:hypothetical protein [Candidatus Parcubacteria bacterium]
MSLLESAHPGPFDKARFGGRLERRAEAERPDWLEHALPWISTLWEEARTNPQRQRFFTEEFHWLSDIEEKAKEDGVSFGADTYLSDMITYGLEKKLITVRRADMLKEHIRPLGSDEVH